MNNPFEVYLGSAVGASPEAGTTLLLPATPYEILDALERARITVENKPYLLDFVDCELESLPQFIAPDANLYELNHLAQRLAELDNWQLDCFEGMTMMDAAKNANSPIPLEQLINMTYSTADCQIAYEVFDDKSLGKFYVDNDFPVIPDNLPEEVYELLDHEAIGRKTRMGEGGVFTEKGYVVQSGEMAQIYKSGDAVPQEKPNYTVMLEVCKGWFSDPEYNSGASEYPMLPADDGIIQRAIAQVEAKSIEECSIRAGDCIVPKLSEIISDALYASDGDCYGAVNELAVQLQRLEQSGKLYTYKAMVEAAPRDISLEDALDLSYQTAAFSVMREAASPADYARSMLSKYCIEMADELFANTNLQAYGEKLIAEKGVSMTEYGTLWSLTGETVEQCLDRPSQSQGMEMK